MSEFENPSNMESSKSQPERLLTLDEAWNTELKVGDIIQGLTTTDDYDMIEVLAAEHFEAELRRCQFISNPLGTAIRPPKFQGELRNGIAAVVPTNLSALNYQRQVNHSKLLAEPDVLSFFIHANIHSSAGGNYGEVARLVTYFKRARGKLTSRDPAAYYKYHNWNLYGKIGRKLWPAPKNMIGEQLTEESSERAQKVMAYALRHIFGGGLPS